MIKRKIYKLMITFRLMFTQKKKRILVFNTPAHGNLGDHAIAKAEFRFLNHYFPNIEVIEIYEDIWDYSKDLIKKFITKDDLILLHGGGYLGDLWPVNERKAMDIIKSFHNNSIYYFPQTCYYYNTSNSGLFNTNKHFYIKSNNLKFMTRDTASYNFIQEHFVSNKDNCKLYPDMVTYINIDVKEKKKKEILICFREDHEKISDNNNLDIVKKYANDHNYKIKKVSTVLDRRISPYERDKELNNILKQFASVELVITDRLHGMVFSAIAGTPCIALDNLSKKVSGVYEWINYLEYVKVIDSKELTNDVISEYINLRNCHYENQRLIKYFDDMANYINVDLQ